MQVIDILIQVLVFSFVALVLLDMIRDCGLQEFAVKKFERMWLGDCTPVNYFNFSLKDLEVDDNEFVRPRKYSDIDLVSFLELDTNPIK